MILIIKNYNEGMDIGPYLEHVECLALEKRLVSRCFVLINHHLQKDL